MKVINCLTLGVVLIIGIFIACNRPTNEDAKRDIFMRIQKQSFMHRSYYMHLINSPDSVDYFKPKMDSVTVLYDQAVADYNKSR